MKGPVKKSVRALLVAACLCGCATEPGFFPVGLYDVPKNDYPKVAAAGFNSVVGRASRENLDAAATNGLKVVAHVPHADLETVRRLDSHRALWLWYLTDEPDMNLVSPRAVAQMNSNVRKVARKPTFIVLMSGAAAEKYRDTSDRVGVDWYPITWAPVATVAREMRLARLALNGKPFFAILQAFDWNAFPHLLRTDAALRSPTTEEMRCMAYLALMQGASGLFFYTYDIEKWKLHEHPELWQSTSTLAKEIRENAAIFEERVNWWPVEAETHGAPTEMYNEIMEARVLLSLFKVSKDSGSVRKGYYMIAANTSGLPTDFSFALPFTTLEQFETTRAGEPFIIEGKSIRKSFAPFEVAIFGPINGQIIE